jgi:hypothetical protein
MANKKTQEKETSLLKVLYKFFTSFKLATVVFVLMTIVTLFGTLAQVEMGLFAAKEKYFHSVWIIDEIGNFPVFLPGGGLLMVFLFINMTLGSVVKVKKRWKGAGTLISHIGMLMLFGGAFVTWGLGTDGYMALYPGMKSDRVESYRKWQLEVMPLNDDASADEVWILPADELSSIRPRSPRSYTTDDLPFEIIVSDYSPNAIPTPITAPMAAGSAALEIDGFKLLPQRKAKEAAANIPGCYVEFKPKSGDSDKISAILSAYSFRFDPGEKPMPFVFELGGQKFGALISKKSWHIPFEVQLDEFIFDRHPGISMARNYESRVTRLESDKGAKPLEIKMNEPMRYEGYTFFQESFGPAGSQPGDRMYSQFAVANNPADQWPLWALVVTSIGLGVHFVIMLLDYMARSRKKRIQAAS